MRRGHQGNRHPADAEGVPGLGGLVVGESRQRQDEQQGSDDVRRVGCGLDVTVIVLIRSSPSVDTGSCRENMPSIRRVTANPPNTLMLASRIATKASAVTSSPLLVAPWPICSSAPTTMIPEIALVTDINGVCRAWCTCPMT